MAEANDRIIKSLKKGIWCYFLLLIFEGALRKWVLPQLAAPLLIVRDPFAIWIIFTASRYKIWKPNGFVLIIVLVNILSFITTMLLGHGNIIVAVYGLRILLLHFPLVFIIGRVYDHEDVLKLGRVLLWINIFMTLLVAIQFFSPQSAWVNRGVGGDETGSGFSGTVDFFRVPGTFSFTNGLSLFYGFVAAYVCYFWADLKSIPKYLLISSTIALCFAVPLSISRTVLFEVILSIAFMFVISSKQIGKLLRTLAILGILTLVLSPLLNKSDVFKTATGAFTERFETANESEGGLEGVFVDRFLGGMYSAVVNENASFFGMGIGMGTNAGARLMVGNDSKLGFLISEGEWGRLVGEMGFLLGLLIILVRFGVVMKMFRIAWDSSRYKNFLPWMILSFAWIQMLQGQWAQPTSLGFGVLSAGLIFAAAKGRTIDKGDIIQ